MQDGIYEQIINQQIFNELTNLSNQDFDIRKTTLEAADARELLTNYLANVIKDGLLYIRDNNKSSTTEDKRTNLLAQLELCNSIIEQVAKHTDNSQDTKIVDQGEVLTALYHKINTIRTLDNQTEVIRPTSSIVENTLFTGNTQEPSMMEELKKEILSSDRVDLLVSFIKWSAIRPLLSTLKQFTQNPNHQLRVISTTYTKATDFGAVKVLSELPNTEVKINYSQDNQRLHAKSYIFYRETGFSTAYIGSSNLSSAALTTGLEWNIKVTEQESDQIVKKCSITFDQYWNNDAFETFDPTNELAVQKLKDELDKTVTNDFHLETAIRPYAYQQEILDELETERTVYHRHRNLVVAATGVGKTIIAAFDFKRYLAKHPNAKLLFVAHRKEILEQSIRKFREVLNDFNFGQLAVGGYTPNNLDHLFISVQTFNSLKLADKTSADNYDFIIIDEVHHAEAKSYQQLLSYYQPQILLGLTATPDRMDGADIRKYFDGNVASEMLLGEAINRQLLSPFQYYGVTDSIDYSQITWTRGKYDEQELTKSYLNNHERDQIIIQKVLDYSNDLNEIKGLGFCVSVEHAEYMAQLFNNHQISALCVTGQTNNTDREDAKRQLTNGKVKFIFTVDLYNEGVDIPAVNMVLFLRPTQSATIFLQQLGRGLRLSPGKDCLTVLDFIGQANKQYSYRTKFRSLIGKTRHTLKKEVESNFAHVPNGCYIEMEPKAKEYILENLGQTEVNKKNLVNMMIEFNNQTEKELTLANFLTEFDVTLPELYANGRSFHRLKQWAHLTTDQRDVTDSVWKKFRNFFHIDSPSLLDCWIGVIEGSHQIDLTNELERLQLGMLYYSLYKKYPAKEGFTSLLDGILTFIKEDFVKDELLAVLRYRRSQIKIVPMANEYQYTTPLEVHCHYNRAQIMAAYDYYNQEQSPEFREGVKYIDTHKTDIFLISLNKTEKDFSPSTMYEDYAINESIFHWQSQRTQSNTSNTIQRYRNHLSTNNYISLFIREYPRVNGIAQPYMFMGNADYQTSNGSQPVNFTWKLHQRIPASLINSATKTSDQ